MRKNQSSKVQKERWASKVLFVIRKKDKTKCSFFPEWSWPCFDCVETDSFKETFSGFVLPCSVLSCILKQLTWVMRDDKHCTATYVSYVCGNWKQNGKWETPIVRFTSSNLDNSAFNYYYFFFVKIDLSHAKLNWKSCIKKEYNWANFPYWQDERDFFA